MSKEQRELEVLKQIYKEPVVTIKHIDKPDFVIEGQDEKFGVEITDYYYNDSSARLKNMPGYIERILNSNDDSVLDKRDKGLISKTTLYLMDTRDNQYKYVGDNVALKYDKDLSWDEDPDYVSVEERLIEIINDKDSKSNEYEKLDYCELFIQDREGYFAKDNNRQISLYNSDSILNAVANSNFKRVYLFSGNTLNIIGDKPIENMLKYNMIDNVSSKGDVNHE